MAPESGRQHYLDGSRMDYRLARESIEMLAEKAEGGLHGADLLLERAPGGDRQFVGVSVEKVEVVASARHADNLPEVHPPCTMS